MITQIEKWFAIPDFDRMQDGEVALRAPSLCDIVQIHAERHDATARLFVEKNGPRIHVRRIDGPLLQVAINGFNRQYDEANEPRVGLRYAYAVFTRPVDVMMYERHSDNPVWRASGEGVDTPQALRMQEFSLRLADYTFEKQLELLRPI